MGDTIKVRRDGPRGWHIIAIENFDPAIHEPVEGSGQAPRMQGTPEELGLVGAMSDDQLREAIKIATGRAPHHKAGRDKLLEQFNAINLDQDVEASNGLTRREIEADLTGMDIEFDPRDALEDLAALRDMAREDRD